MACTTDNATNNDSLMNTLEATCKDRNIDFIVKNNHIRYLAYIINLTAQAALSSLKVSYAENETEILNKNYGMNEIIPKVSHKVIFKIKLILIYYIFLYCANHYYYYFVSFLQFWYYFLITLFTLLHHFNIISALK